MKRKNLNVNSKLKEISDGLQEAQISNIRESLNERVVEFARSENDSLLAVAVKIYEKGKIYVYNVKSEVTIQEIEFMKELRSIAIKGLYIFAGHTEGVDVLDIVTGHSLLTFYNKLNVAFVLFCRVLFVIIEKPNSPHWAIYKVDSPSDEVDQYRNIKSKKVKITPEVTRVLVDPERKYIVAVYRDKLVGIDQGLGTSGDLLLDSSIVYFDFQIFDQKILISTSSGIQAAVFSPETKKIHWLSNMTFSQMKVSFFSFKNLFGKTVMASVEQKSDEVKFSTVDFSQSPNELTEISRSEPVKKEGTSTMAKKAKTLTIYSVLSEDSKSVSLVILDQKKLRVLKTTLKFFSNNKAMSVQVSKELAFNIGTDIATKLAASDRDEFIVSRKIKGITAYKASGDNYELFQNIIFPQSVVQLEIYSLGEEGAYVMATTSEDLLIWKITSESIEEQSLGQFHIQLPVRQIRLENNQLIVLAAASVFVLVLEPAQISLDSETPLPETLQTPPLYMFSTNKFFGVVSPKETFTIRSKYEKDKCADFSLHEIFKNVDMKTVREVDCNSNFTYIAVLTQNHAKEGSVLILHEASVREGVMRATKLYSWTQEELELPWSIQTMEFTVNPGILTFRTFFTLHRLVVGENRILKLTSEESKEDEENNVFILNFFSVCMSQAKGYVTYISSGTHDLTSYSMFPTAYAGISQKGDLDNFLAAGEKTSYAIYDKNSLLVFHVDDDKAVDLEGPQYSFRWNITEVIQNETNRV